MGKSTSKQIKKSKDKGVRLDVTDDELFAFLYGDKVQKLLEEEFKVALEGGEDRDKLTAIRDLLDRYFGKATEKKQIDHTTDGEKIEGIFVTDFKDEDK